MSSITSEPSSSGQRGNGSGRGRGNGRGGNNNRSAGRGHQQTAGRPSRVFKGDTSEMNGHVFQCSEEQTDRMQFKNTKDALQSYVKKTLKHAEDLSPLFAMTMTAPTIDMPHEPGADATRTEELIYTETIKQFIKRQSTLQSNLATIHAVGWGQCSKAMQARLKTLDGYQTRSDNNDCLWLLESIRAVTLELDEKKHGVLSLLDARSNMLNCRQGTNQTVSDYREALKGWADAIMFHGGSVAERIGTVPSLDENNNERTLAEREKIATEETLAMLMIRGADPTKYGTLIADLNNQFVKGKDEYPKDMATAETMLELYETPTNQPSNQRTRPPRHNTPSGTATETGAMTFAQTGNNRLPYDRRVAASVAGTDGVLHPGISCFGGCGGYGHYSDACPGPTTVSGTTITTVSGNASISGTTLTQYAYMLAQSKGHGIDPDWVLLDSQSTISVIKNADMLTNIRPSKHTLRALTNGGHQDSTMIGDFPNLGEVWYNAESIANILSLADVRKVCRVTMDTSSEPALLVHRLDGSIMKFAEHASGLYVYSPKSNHTVTAYTMVSTVANQKKMFSRREINAADTARDLYRKLGRPDAAEFDLILRHNHIRNCPVTPADAHRALLIYGPDVPAAKGKTTRSTAAAHVPTFEAVPIPPPIMEHHRHVTLCLDLFFVQQIPFFHSISRGIGFRTVRRIPDRGRPTLLHDTTNTIRLYEARGFSIADIHADHEFECLRDELRPISMNIVPPDSHVGEVERSIRTIKERVRACAHGLPFKRLPILLIQHMVDEAVRCLNQFPWKNGISPDLSPSAIVLGHTQPDYNKMRLEFGTYVQVFEDNDPSNTLKARSLGAIALGPTGNAQGDYNFMSLATGHKLSRHQWLALPMPDTAIARVEALAIADGQPLLQASGLVIEWRPDQPIDDDEYDHDYVPPTQPPPHDPFVPGDDFDPLDDNETADLLHDAALHGLYVAPQPPVLAADQGAHNMAANADPWIFNNDHAIIEDSDNDNNNEHNNNDDNEVFSDNDDAANEAHYDAEYDSNDEHDEGAHDAPHDNNDNTNDDDNSSHDEGADNTNDNEHDEDQHQRYSLRTRHPTNRFHAAMDNPHSSKSYDPPHTQLSQWGTPVPDKTKKHIFGYVMTQMTAKAGIKKHGAAAVAALMKEFAQLEDLGVYEAVDATLLTQQERRGALRAINLIKEKRDGKLKGRTVADGSVQRSLYDKSETASPTVSTDALLLSILIDAHEGRDVATADIAGAYLKADMDDFVLMKFTGESVDVLCELNPKHLPFVVTEKSGKALYVKLVKAIYGCVKSALLWYEVFHSSLKDMGFTLNPYDSCMANCIMNGKQCTIAWYVDDTKISHVDPDVVTTVIDKLENRFGKMTVTRGEEHTFLGMHITYTSKRTAVISMKSYLQEAIEECNMHIERTSNTPATRTLFTVNDSLTRLKPDEAEVFHKVVAKLLYVALRGRPDILLAVIFLCTRVAKSTVEDQGKLRRLLEYIKGTMDLEYTLGADHLGKFRTWIDASYAVHPDMKSHTGGIMSLGLGGFLPKSMKQKLNTKSSTEAEVVGASDYLPNTLWVKMFMEAQGYEIEESYLEQDNESAIKLEKNGRSSAGAKSRHIDIRYFWIKDRTHEHSITIRHCPTLHMLADFFTKPLQGALFKKFRDVILGYQHVDSLALIPMSEPEERVGGSEQSTEIRADGPDADGFLLVTGRKRKTEKPVISDACVAKVTRKVNVNVATNTIKKQRNEDVSRVHSLETIQLMK